MTKGRAIFGAVVLFAAATAAAVPQAEVPSVAGIWEMTVQSPQGDMTTDITFTQEKSTIQASMIGPQGMELSGEGTLKGNEIQWTFTISWSNGDFVLTYKGKVEGEVMTGEVDTGDYGAFPWTAKKKK